MRHALLQAELKCVLAVCVHNHPIMIKIYPVLFYLVKSFPLSQIEPISDACLCDVTWDSHDSWLTLAFYLRPALSELSSVRHCCDAGADVEKNVSIAIEVFCCWCNNEHTVAVVIYSRHLSRWRRSGLHLVLKGMRPLINLNASIFAQIIRDPALPPEEVRVRFFNESLQISFPNNVLIRKFHNECS